MRKIAVVGIAVGLAIGMLGAPLGCATDDRNGARSAATQVEGDANLLEAVSLQGESLDRPEIDEDRAEEFREKLREARRNYEADPVSEERIIWYGRRLAYMGRYRDAIAIYSRGLEIHPGSARLLRHRGHRYISLRRFDEAIADLTRAARLAAGEPDQVEPDGLPNARNTPRSTLKTNIYYHLGLAYYLRGEWDSALGAYRECLKRSENDDMAVAAMYWIYLTLERMGRSDEASEVLARIEPEMNIIENESYHRLLLMFKEGEMPRSAGVSTLGDGVENATIAYGRGMKHLLEGDVSAARRIFREILDQGAWPAFGHIAAEAELARMNDLRQ